MPLPSEQHQNTTSEYTPCKTDTHRDMIKHMLGCLGKAPPDRSLFNMSDYIIQQLDLLCWRIRRQHMPSGKHEIVTTQFFPKIIQLFQQSHSTYTAESPPSDGCYPWVVRQNLAGSTSSTTIVSGVFNILDSHWVLMTVDVERHMISYGDSFISDKKTKEVAMRAVEWWSAYHR